LILQALAPFLTKVIGIDLSDNMIDEFNRHAAAVGVSDKVTGYKADLLGDSVAAEFSGPEFTDFDVVTVSMALHHFENPGQALERLASRVKKGGVCLIIDFVPHAPYEHGHGSGHGHEGHDVGDASATVKTHGFSPEDMQKLFQGAGLSARFDYEVLPEPFVFTKDDKTMSKTAFIARAQRV
jgi:SAM-dependent methyltransferase